MTEPIPRTPLHTWNVESESKPGTFYTVTEYSDGTFACSCPHFIYRKPVNGCKHIKWAKIHPEKAQKPHETTPIIPTMVI